MLRLSKLTDYGTVIMTHMARQPARVYSAAEVATAVGVTVPTASKILKTLARENLLQSLRGAHGGYLLSRPPDEISIAQVIDAMEGPVGVTECSAALGLCAQEGSCSLQANWQRVNQIIRRVLSDLTLADMAQPVFRPVNVGALRARQPREGARQ
jgi:FeS assembly SUF system regulator